MNWLDHEYLVPVIIGNGKEAIKVARKIYRKSGRRAQIFAESFTFFQRLEFSCHTVFPMKESFVFESLLAFSRSLEEYFYPVIIVYDDFSQEIVDKNSDIIESAFLVRSYDEL